MTAPQRPGNAGRSFSRDQVAAAVNAAAGAVEALPHTDDRDTDLINLIVNVTLAKLDNPAVTLDQAIEASYETDPAEVKGWL